MEGAAIWGTTDLRPSEGQTADVLRIFNVDGYARWRFDKDGRLSYGLASSSAALEVCGAAIFNKGGAQYDFQVEGHTNPYLFFTDASADRIGIGTNSPVALLDVRGDAVFNEDGGQHDFRLKAKTAI